MPALPEKNALEKYKMTAEFVEQRRAALNVFINRVVRVLWAENPLFHLNFNPLYLCYLHIICALELDLFFIMPFLSSEPSKFRPLLASKPTA